MIGLPAGHQAAGDHQGVSNEAGGADRLLPGCKCDPLGAHQGGESQFCVMCVMEGAILCKTRDGVTTGFH